MKELIEIKEQDGQQLVSARELHAFLKSRQDFSTWIKKRIKEYQFVENQDYVSLHKIVERETGATTRIEYGLTLDTAKELAMVERNEKGRQARHYFIEVEKQAKQPLSQIDIIIKSAQVIKQNSRQLHEHEVKIKELEAKTTTRPECFTIAGYATLLEMPMPLKLACSLGRKASKLCKKSGIVPDEIYDQRFGKIKSYPRQILEQVFSLSII